MRILAIRIKNLASLEGLTEIDFNREPLCSAGIFAITGPTGAGKSTILDALCLALYGKAPRYRGAENGIDIIDVQGSTIKQDDVRGILRDGTSEGFAEVDFTAVDGQNYRATWSVRRARNKASGNLLANEMTLKNISANQDVPGKKTELLVATERLAGLSFEQFTRSVLLAQGDFTAFLKAGKNEKSSLLEKLTGTHIYSEISKRIFENHRVQYQNLTDLNTRREGIAILTTEELIALKKDKAGIDEVIKLLEKQIAGLNKEIAWHGQLSQFQEAIATAKVQYERVHDEKTVALSREQKLLKIIQVQPARPILTDLHNTSNQLAGKSKQSGELTTVLSDLQQQKEKLDIASIEIGADLNTKIQDREDAQDPLNTAKALDVQLSEKAAQIKQSLENVNLALNNEKQQALQLAATQNELNLLENSIGELRLWQASNEARRPISEQENIILSKLDDAENILASLNTFTSLIKAAGNEIEKNQQEIDRLNIKQTSLQASVKKSQRENKSLLESFSGIRIRDLETEKASVDASIEDIISAEANWKLLYNALTEKDILAASLEKNKIGYTENGTKLEGTAKLLEAMKLEKDVSQKLLEKAKLAAAENVENLRMSLESDQACPVCGSTHHPYAYNDYKSDLILAELEASHQQAEEKYTQQLDSLTNLNQVIIHLGETIKTQNNEITLKVKQVKELEMSWTKFKIYNSCSAQPPEKRNEWLQQEIQQYRKRQQELRGQIQSYGEQKNKLDLQNDKLSQLEKDLNANANIIKDAERSLKSIQEQLARDTEIRQQANKSLDNVKKLLTAYFPSELWFEKWRNDPEKFAKSIKEFARQWKSSGSELEEKIRQHGAAIATLNGMEQKSKDLLEEVKLKKQKLTQQQAQLNVFSDKRKLIFSGDPVQQVEERLKKAINDSNAIAELHKRDDEKLQAELTRNLARTEQLEKDIAALSKQEIELKSKIYEWLKVYERQYDVTIMQTELLSLLEFTPEWIEKERASMRDMDDAMMQAKSILMERSTAAELHAKQHISERTAEDASILQVGVQSDLKENSKAANEIDFKIRQDIINRERIGHLLHDIERQSLVVDNWAKLNEIIGSADGKKFRQIAQEYTLDVLLSFANVHLELLSKRYVLQRIPNSLGLQVIDRDMGDEVRTVYSLSGGESFLVSLALALGLASLSSSRMKVESLFIDEGFGALDPATLNIAMDALERLHNQGRKVGVISHVQEMTERIGVQIRVSKGSGGMSLVEVI